MSQVQYDNSLGVETDNKSHDVIPAKSGSWDLDASLMLLVGLMTIAFMGVFLSARQLDPLSRHSVQPATHRVGAAGVVPQAVTASDIAGIWQGEDLTFHFLDGQTVEVMDKDSEATFSGTWDYTPAMQTLSVAIPSKASTIRLTFSVDHQVLILSDSQDSSLQPGLVLTKG